MADLLGLGLGTAIGGVALAVILPIVLAPDPLPAATAVIQQTPPPTPPVRRPAVQPRRPAPTPVTVEMPHIVPTPGTHSDALPNIIYPDSPPSGGDAKHQPGAGVAGTGFFVAPDGSLVTAAHVVNGCRETRIVSKLVQPAVAQLIAADSGHDIALLRAAHVTPPATLPIGRPAAPDGKLFVLGYPASGGPLVATETWATLQNRKFTSAPADIADPRRVIWASAPEVNHGFSGGPMLDPRNGEVVGIIRGMVDSSRLHAAEAEIPASGMVTGPGSALLAALLRQEGTDTNAQSESGDDALDIARRATVHVLCLY